MCDNFRENDIEETERKLNVAIRYLNSLGFRI